MGVGEGGAPTQKRAFVTGDSQTMKDPSVSTDLHHAGRQSLAKAAYVNQRFLSTLWRAL